MSLLESEHRYFKSIFGDLLADATVEMEGGRPTRVTYSLVRNGYELLTEDSPILDERSHIATEDWENLRQALDRRRIVCEQEAGVVANPDVKEVLQSFMLPDRDDCYAYRTYRDPVTNRTRLVILWGTLPAAAVEDSVIAALNTPEREAIVLASLASWRDRLLQTPWMPRAIWGVAGVICVLLVLLFLRWLGDDGTGAHPGSFVSPTDVAIEESGSDHGEAVTTAGDGTTVGAGDSSQEEEAFIDRVRDWLFISVDDDVEVLDTGEADVVIRDGDPDVTIVEIDGDSVAVPSEGVVGVDTGPDSVAGVDTVPPGDPGDGLAPVSTPEDGLAGGSGPDTDPRDPSPLGGGYVFLRLHPERGVVKVHLGHPVSLEYYDEDRIGDEVPAEDEHMHSPRPGAGLRTIWVPVSEELLRQVDPETLDKNSVPSPRPGTPASSHSADFYKLTLDDRGRIIAKELVSVSPWDS